MSKYFMVDKKFAFLMIKKVGLFISIVGLIAARAEHPAISSDDLEDFDNEPSAIGHFLQQNLRVTTGTYSGNIGTFDIFSVGNRHHVWGQLGGLGGPYLVGGGSGYRYLFRNSNPHQEHFFGGYALVGMHAFKANKTRKKDSTAQDKNEIVWPDLLSVGCLGGEWGTNRWQWTFQHGWGKILKARQVVAYQHVTRSTSVRLSSYYMQKFYLLGRVNSFVFGARSNVLNTVDKKEVTLCTGGFGARWEHRYCTIEPRVIWGENLERPFSLWPRPYIGIQLHFDDHRNPKDMHSVKSRLLEAPQSYYPNHYAFNPAPSVEGPNASKQREASEKSSHLKKHWNRDDPLFKI